MVDGGGDPEAGGEHVGPRLLGLLQLPGELLDQFLLAEARRGLAALVVDLLLGVDDTDRHLGPPEVDADGLPRRHDPVRFWDGFGVQEGSDGMRQY